MVVAWSNQVCTSLRAPDQPFFCFSSSNPPFFSLSLSLCTMNVRANEATFPLWLEHFMEFEEEWGFIVGCKNLKERPGLRGLSDEQVWVQMNRMSGGSYEIYGYIGMRLDINFARDELKRFLQEHPKDVRWIPVDAYINDGASEEEKAAIHQIYEKTVGWLKDELKKEPGQ